MYLPEGTNILYSLYNIICITFCFIKLAVHSLPVYSYTAVTVELLIPPRLALFLRWLLPSISCILSDVLLVSNVALGTHDRNIAPCGTICKVSMDATVFWVCRKWNNKEGWGWFVLLVYLRFEDIEEPAPDLELLL